MSDPVTLSLAYMRTKPGISWCINNTAIELITYSIAVYSTFKGKTLSVVDESVCLFRAAVYDSSGVRAMPWNLKKASLGIRSEEYVKLQ